MKPILLFDFDSTITNVEALDLLGEQLAANGRLTAHDVAQIKHITDQGMAGEIGFGQSLEKRLDILKLQVADLQDLIATLHHRVSESIDRNKAWFLSHSDRIWIVSSGFKEFIAPVVHRLGIEPDRILANEFVWDSRGIGHVAKASPLAHDQGKPKVVVAANFTQPVWIIGDGYTDYEIKLHGAADKFLAFTENVRRPGVADVADHVLLNLEELIELDRNA